MGVYIGSARIDERGKASGGAVGDQKQAAAQDYAGEVSMQKFYVASKGWNILRAKDANIALRIAAAMITACNNKNIGYDQSNRLGVIKYGTGSTVKTECDCSSLVRQCVKEAAGVDAGNFTTANEKNMLTKTGLYDALTYSAGMTLYTGDILVTRTQGHTVVVTSGAARNTSTGSYYPVYSGSTTSIVAALAAVGEKDTSYAHREKIAKANGVAGYKGTAAQNTGLLNLLKQGKLKKA
jgi:hypothetical protein